MDLQKMLRASVYLNRLIDNKKQLHWAPEARVQNAFVALDVELAEVANTSEWFKVWKTHRGKHDEGKNAEETLLYEYVDAMDFFLLISNLKNWNHVILNTQPDLEKIAGYKREQNMDKQYLIIKKMLFNAYFERSEAAFSHCFRLFIKMGLVEFGFSEDQIETAFMKKNELNKQRQADNY